MISMMRGFSFMLHTIKDDIDVDLLHDLHDVAVSLTHNIATNNLFKSGYTKNQFASMGNFGFELEFNSSIKGLDEFVVRIEKSNCNHYIIQAPNKVCSTIIDRPKTEKEILDVYNTSKKSLKDLITCAQELEDSHLFEDANIRTLAFLLINRELITKGEAPTIWDNPNVLDAFSNDELVQIVKAGQ